MGEGQSDLGVEQSSFVVGDFYDCFGYDEYNLPVSNKKIIIYSEGDEKFFKRLKLFLFARSVR